MITPYLQRAPATTERRGDRESVGAKHTRSALPAPPRSGYLPPPLQGRLRNHGPDPDTRRSYFPEPPSLEHDGGTGPQAPLPAVTGINGFDGITASQGGFFRPPDSMGAVGPSSFIEEINSAVAIYNKTTGVPITGGGITSLHDFFAPVRFNNDFTGDPVVAYNDITGKFGVGAENAETPTMRRTAKVA